MRRAICIWALLLLLLLLLAALALAFAEVELAAEDRSGELPELTESDSLVVREVVLEEDRDDNGEAASTSLLLVVALEVVAVPVAAEAERWFALRPSGAPIV